MLANKIMAAKRMDNAICHSLIFLHLGCNSTHTIIRLTGDGVSKRCNQAGFAREESFALKWMLLTEGGGRWLIPALFGLACGAISERMIKK